VDGQRVAAIGFCFGGTTALELMRSGAPLAAVATFHSGLLPELPDDAGRARARLLVCHGAEDPLVKKEAIDALMAELRRDKVDPLRQCGAQLYRPRSGSAQDAGHGVRQQGGGAILGGHAPPVRRGVRLRSRAI
jgi:dienelactone hydrolase